MVTAIVLVIIGAFLFVPLLPQIKYTHTLALRTLIGIGFFWLALMGACRWLAPQTYAPAHRAYEWSDGSVPVQISLRLFYFFPLIAAGLGIILLWVEYRFYRLSPNENDRRHVLADLVLVAVYLGLYVAFIHMW